MFVTLHKQLLVGILRAPICQESPLRAKQRLTVGMAGTVVACPPSRRMTVNLVHLNLSLSRITIPMSPKFVSYVDSLEDVSFLIESLSF